MPPIASVILRGGFLFQINDLGCLVEFHGTEYLTSLIYSGILISERIFMFLKKLDCILIDWFERQSHRFQRLVGKDCFWLAELCLYAFIATWFIFGEYQVLIGHASASLMIISGLFICLLAISFFVMLQYNKQMFEKNPQFKNNARSGPTERRIRLAWLGIFAFNLAPFLMGVYGTVYDYASLTSALLLFLFSYLAACTPLPPGTSIFRKMLNRAGEALTPNIQTTPDPAQP